jgi:hypothetical protein
LGRPQKDLEINAAHKQKLSADQGRRNEVEGLISLEEGKSMTTELEVTEGMSFDSCEIVDLRSLLPDVNYVGGARQLPRRVLPLPPPARAGGGDSEN